MRRTHLSAVSVVSAVLVVALAGCASAPADSPRAIEADALAALEEADAARVTALRTAVRAHVAGLLTDAQFDAVAELGRQLDTAILSAGVALETYLSIVKAGAPASRADLDVKLALVKAIAREMKGGAS